MSISRLIGEKNFNKLANTKKLKDDKRSFSKKESANFVAVTKEHQILKEIRIMKKKLEKLEKEREGELRVKIKKLNFV